MKESTHEKHPSTFDVRPRRDMTAPLLFVVAVAVMAFLTFELWLPHSFPH